MDLESVKEIFLKAISYNDHIYTFITGGVGGALVTRAFAYFQGRANPLEYNVINERVAVSTDDPIFGSIRTTWQDMGIKNLFVSTVILKNANSRDYKDFHFKAYTGSETSLLSQYSEVMGTSYILDYTKEYLEKIRIEPDNKPTDLQVKLYYHSREYQLSVFRRDQQILIRFLTTVSDGASQPAVYLDTLYPDVCLKYRINENKIHGVPVKTASLVGLGVFFIILIAGVYAQPDAMKTILACSTAGLLAQPLGAYVFRLYKFLQRVFIS